MASKNKKAEETETEECDTDGDVGRPAQRGIWLDKVRWKKLQLVRDQLGNWRRFTDVVVEQLLASGIINKETREAIHKLNRDHKIDCLEDSGWRDAFKIHEPWPETAANIKKITEELAAIQYGLTDLAQAVEDHATAMLEAELVRPDDSDS